MKKPKRTTTDALEIMDALGATSPAGRKASRRSAANSPSVR